MPKTTRSRAFSAPFYSREISMGKGMIFYGVGLVLPNKYPDKIN